MKKIASFGCGVDSVAGLLMSNDYDEVIFSDTGSERPETYAYLHYFQKKSGIDITVVNNNGIKIYDYYYDKQAQPSQWRRDCTGKFKIRPIRRYLRNKYGKKETFEMSIFIDYSEAHRMRESDVKYITNAYPLVDAKLSRDGLKEFIADCGYEVPIKSGCFFCPYTTKRGWIDLKAKHPDLYQKTLDMEKNSTMNMPLISLKGKDSMTLIECGCFNG